MAKKKSKHQQEIDKLHELLGIASDRAVGFERNAEYLSAQVARLQEQIKERDGRMAKMGEDMYTLFGELSNLHDFVCAWDGDGDKNFARVSLERHLGRCELKAENVVNIARGLSSYSHLGLYAGMFAAEKTK